MNFSQLRVTTHHPVRALVIDLILFVSFVVAVMLWWQDTLLATIITSVIALVGFAFFHAREDIVFFVTAAVFGSFTESVVIGFGMWQYGNPYLLGLSLWTPFFWGFSFLFARRMRDAVFSLAHVDAHYTRHHRELSAPLMALIDVLLYALIIIVALVWWKTSWLLLLVYCVLLLVAISVYHTRADVFFVVAAMVCGSSLEAVGTYYGAWTHNNSVLLGMPVWLPVAYGLFALIVRRAAVMLNVTMRAYGQPKEREKMVSATTAD